MRETPRLSATRDLAEHGIRSPGKIHWNLTSSELVEHALARKEGVLAENGALVVRTGEFTGRSPRDKYVVRDEFTGPHVVWGAVNRPAAPDVFDRLYGRMLAYLHGRELYVQDCFAGADSEYSLSVRVINEVAWHNLFARQLFLPPENHGQPHHPDFTLLNAPGFHADPQMDGTVAEPYIMVNLTRGLVLIGGTAYAGEMKKSIFTVLNYLLPFRRVLPMHCAANLGVAGDVALFFGLSGTGKTTLSADPARRLIGDDEHGWSDRGVFNFEGGCYAKCIRLSREHEPQIWSAIRFGTVLENVVIDQRRRLDFSDETITENTRAAYPIHYIENAVMPGLAGHPANIFFLSADAFGVLPPIARLTPAQALYFFLSGYTAKLAGTEAGLGKEPQAAFSTCFGQPFLPLRPTLYAGMLGEKLRSLGASVWLVNTGWFGGAYGVGRRMHLPHTRAMIAAALGGALDDVPCEVEPVFGLHVPVSCPDVSAEVLNPRDAWADKNAYDAQARHLAALFVRNFQQFTDASEEVREAGPRVTVEAA
jgi:phosphoenolpyruvate carboxykinase (ATP)